ncbi:flagellar biosynthesis protein FlaG [Pseudomonas sp. R-28-1W-6]|uniref:flagellar protein FlaG n=1 Tax=Pseudomonas sp. R-28-1W-6 TaxID=2650101 RepID=UPI001365AC8D|nr:flagellar protein FlaG [Pseudomonas sp. R-28-1W-6]MWV12562.1 flagellar biosynthesis protein FlaG [Pseudomonas sp. R-28-1W-6]
MDIGISNPLSLVTTGSRSQAGTANGSAVQPELSPATELAARPTATQQPEQSAESVRESVEKAVSSIQGFVQSIRRDLNFDFDDSSGRVVVKVTDSASGDVVRQIPTEDALRLAENLEEIRSLLFKAEA